MDEYRGVTGSLWVLWVYLTVAGVLFYIIVICGWPLGQ